MTKLQIGVMGGAFHYTPKALEAAYIIRKEIAHEDAVLITGGTTGIPYQAARGAKEVGGVSIGISPAIDRKDHVEKFGKPTDAYDALIFTGMGYSGRNPINIRTCDGIIYIGGEAGTLNEFTNGLYEARVLGVLEGVGGITDRIRTIMQEFQTDHGSTVLYDTNPQNLVQRVFSEIRARDPKYLSHAVPLAAPDHRKSAGWKNE
ncbi:MAG TPA: hypothetical protein VJI32_08035 [Candidatus Nanoarchaeia archaeon]|nr:hypothetical protein [Candidatus Nanoarchaeia archaeon]